MPYSSSSSTLHCFLLLSFLAITPSLANNGHQKTHLRPTKKYLRCSLEKFGCTEGEGDRVNLCHYNGKEFTTLCVRSRSSIVEHLHAQDYCGKCVDTTATATATTTNGKQRHAFQTKDELQKAVDQYLDDPTSHKRLSVRYGYPMSQWDVSHIADFSELFAKRVHFNEDIGLWNMTSATSLDRMFWHAHSFEGRGIRLWNVANVQSMEQTFFGATKFDSDLSAWQTASLTNMMGTFWRATSFNSPLNKWDTSNVKMMSRCFSEATSFNQPLNEWDTSNVIDMSYMFMQAVAFQQDLSSWHVGHVETFERMFAKAPYFQQKQVEDKLFSNWRIQKGATVTNMFTAPRDVSLRAQQLQSLQLDLKAIIRASIRAQQNATLSDNTDETTTDNYEDAESLSREILCHGGVCM